MVRCISAISSGEGRPISRPLPTWRRVPPPRNEPILGETPADSTARSQSPKRVQSRIASVHSALTGMGRIEFAIGSVWRPATGAGVQASPMISVVTPCVILDRQRPSIISVRMEWLWISMNPGQATRPAASTTSPH